MNSIKNIIVSAAANRPLLLDAYWPSEGNSNYPTVIFSHGFKGFKDWGHWSLIAESFVQQGFAFVSHNFSHNGTTLDHPTEFADLEAFGQNNFSKEFFDLWQVINWVEDTAVSGRIPLSQSDIMLIGHSRGGPISLITAANDDRVSAVASWASVCRLNYASLKNEDMVSQWEEEGVRYITNGRTGQEMPLYYQLYEDFQHNSQKFNVKSTLANFDKPYIILHGTDDPAISDNAAKQLSDWSPQSKMVLIQGADHVFGGRHPFSGTKLPQHSEELMNATVSFFKKAIEI